jgi:hypothetical protein
MQGFRGSQQNRGFIEAGVKRGLRAVKFRTALAKNDYAAPVGGQNLGGSFREILQEVREFVKTGRFCSELDEISGARGCLATPARRRRGASQPNGRFGFSLSQS